MTSIINSLRCFIQKTTGCSRNKAKELASKYASELPNTIVSCEPNKYPDAIPIQRIYRKCIVTCSMISKEHSASEKLSLIRKFLNNAAAEEAYLNRAH